MSRMGFLIGPPDCPLTGDDPLNCEGGSDLIGRERHASAGPEL